MDAKNTKHEVLLPPLRSRRRNKGRPPSEPKGDKGRGTAYKIIFPLTEKDPEERVAREFATAEIMKWRHYMGFLEDSTPNAGYRLMIKWMKMLLERGRTIQEIAHITDNKIEVVRTYVQRIKNKEV